MPKIKLGQRPQSFKRVVKFKMLDGAEASIEVSYKYRTRTEFGAFIDEIAAAAKAERPEGDDFSVAAIWEKIGSGNADYIMQAVDGWNLDEEFTRENVQQLADELPAAVIAIIDSYRDAITQGRLGN
ncbi:phage tail assembly chaperone [Caballeronia sp. AZ7_KS35]|uniref:phage tail assembly chaperone n=1 Tax=Caballeronia sp. AZ7_KS35 TaxID=2921762 RepID=UPI0020280360|nr:phage tail assembly chaperone [Caballeronia sp. AZ7_KS35]